MRLADQNGFEGKIAVQMTSTEAKSEVNAQLKRIDKFCKHRFRYDENLAHEGFLFVLDKLEADDWKRVRAWNGKSEFSRFIIVVTSRLLTDFYRTKVGHIRPPTWLKEKDQVWRDAYDLLIVKEWGRREVIEQLQTIYPDREHWYLEEVAGTVLSKCRKSRLEPAPQPDLPWKPPCEMTALELGEALRALLEDEVPPQFAAIVNELEAYVCLSKENRTILRLRFVDGLTVPKIKKTLRLKDDIYKRIDRLLEKIRIACRRAGLDL